MKAEALFYKVKTYQDLTKEELYEVLRLRAEVFVVEQDCVYQDIDGKDSKAMHVLGFKENTLVAYTRLFPPGAYFEQASIGRVVVLEKERAYGYGYDLMKRSILAVEDAYDTTTIKISAQTYLKKFYNHLDFIETGEEYLEDGIPHIGMIRE